MRWSSAVCTYESRVTTLQVLKPADLRWSRCDNNRNKVHKCDVLESSWNRLSWPCPWEAVFHKTRPWWQTVWEPLLLTNEYSAFLKKQFASFPLFFSDVQAFFMFSRWYFVSYIYEVSSLIMWFIFSYGEWCISKSFLFYCRWIYQCFPLELVPRLAYLKCIHFLSSVQFSHSVVSNSLWPHGLQHARPPCPSPTPGACSNSCPLSRWCHPTISSSVVPFSSRLQSFPASGSFQMNQLFTSGGQSIGVLASASVLPQRQ